MTKIINDSIDVTLEIDRQPWFLVEAKVVLSRSDTPNYVDLLIVPDPDETAPTLPENIDNLIGANFRLEADNDLISERDTDAEEDSLLFAGRLANISATGENYYEALAYNPAQQPFAPSAEEGGSIMNDKIYLGQPEYDYASMYDSLDGTQYEVQTIQAKELIERVVDHLGFDEEDYVIELEEDGVTIEGEEGSYNGAYDRPIRLHDTWITIKDALNKLREWCGAEWWFDKTGKFHFGLPDPTRHELKYITDADAGKTTPPYQSVRVIGSGSASAEGFARTNMNIEDKIVVEARMAKNESGDIVPKFGETTSNVYEYHNLEISTDEQARTTAKKLIEELGEQQADGTVTVVGYPEVTPMDGIVMPAGEDGDYEDETDIRYNQPMGGFGYNVYKVVHHLNNSDGFITQIHVAGVTGVTLTAVSSNPSSSYEIRNYDDASLRPGVLNFDDRELRP